MGPSEFLHELYGDDAPGFLTIFSVPGEHTEWFKATDYVAIDKYVRDLSSQKTKDIYFGIGLRSKKTKGRGSAETVCAIPGAFADLDAGKEGYFETQEQAAACLNSLPCPPTMVVNSGHGLQAWWLFRELETDIQSAQTTIKQVQEMVRNEAGKRGVRIDSVADLARVFRIPGTWNLKDVKGGGQALPVNIYTNGGNRYNPSELLDYAPPPRREAASSSPIDQLAASLVLNADAEPPAAKMDALRDNDRKFKKTWEAKRADLKDPSPSGYCQALANIASRANWTDQEICNLLISWRRKHSPQKMRLSEPKWYARTIIEARTEFMASVKKAEDEHRIEAAVNEVVAGESSGLSKLLGIEVKEIQQQTRPNTRDNFVIVLADGQQLMIGEVAKLLDQATFIGIIAEKTHTVMPRLKATEWNKVLALILKTCKIVPMPEEETPQGQLQLSVQRYIDIHWDGSMTPAEDEMDQRPFMRNGSLWIVGSHFRSWHTSKRQLPQNLTDASFGHLMKLLGFTSKVIGVKLERGRTTWNCYSVPEHLTPPPIVGASEK